MTECERLYGARSINPRKRDFEKSEAWIEWMKHDILFDNFESKLEHYIEPTEHKFIVRFICPDIYETEGMLVIP